MKRLITVFALAAALFALMGCGTGSKENKKQPSLLQPAKIFSLPIGTYQGSESYITDLNPEKESKLAMSKDQLKAVSQTLVSVQALLPAEAETEGLKGAANATHTDLAVSLKASRDQLSQDITDLEIELKALLITSMGFSISKDVKSGLYKISGLQLKTDQDKLVYRLDKRGEGIELDRLGRPIVERDDRFFGHNEEDIAWNNRLDNGGTVSFDEKTGNVSFSFDVDQEKKKYTYHAQFLFSGRVVEEAGVTVLQGEIRVLDYGYNLMKRGSWRVSLQPVVEKKAEAPKVKVEPKDVPQEKK